MRAKFGLTICGFLLFSLPLFASATLTDDFSDLDYTNNPTWTYETWHDSGLEPVADSGSLYVPQQAGKWLGTLVALAFPSEPNTACEVSFDIFGATYITPGVDYSVNAGLRNTDETWEITHPLQLIPGYQVQMSTGAAVYSGSGFESHPENGPVGCAQLVPGLAGAHLSPNGGYGYKSRIKMTFSPVTGFEVYQNELKIISCSNFLNLKYMNQFMFRPSCPGPCWHIDNVSIIYNITQDPLSRGHRILMQRGLQVQAMIPHCDQLLPAGLDLDTFADSNFTAANIWYYPNPDVYLGSPEDGILWGRVAENTFINTLKLSANELPYAYNLVNLQLKDEQDITDPCELELAKTWFADMKAKYPWVLFYTNQSGGVPTSAQLSNYMNYTKPDMLSMDVYPYHNHSLSEFLRYMKVYRDVALVGYNDGTGSKPIPYGVYTQAWRPADGYTMSESELFLNQFVAWAFGCKFTSAYVYTSDSTTGDGTALLFDGYDDSNPTAMFNSHSELNRQARNLGDALVRLLSTDIRIVAGQHVAGGVPVSNTLPPGLSAWSSTADPNITGIIATNLGTLNNGLRGDLYVGYFKPILKILDGVDYQDNTYFMIVNALNDENGNCIQTKQQVRVDFDFHSSGITSLLRMSRNTGLVERVPLIHNGGSKYYMQITLNGGTGDLFKFDTGAPFVGSKCGIKDTSKGSLKKIG